MEDIILIGGGGHCKSCIDVIEQQGKYRIAGIVDIPGKVGSTVLGYPVIASDESLIDLVTQCPNFLITLGMIRIRETRKKMFEQVKLFGGTFPVIISPNTYVSKHATIGEGTIIMAGVIINAGSVIGRNCIINSHALIEHDAVIGDHCHISTATVINGGVEVGENTFVGSGVITKQYSKVKDHCIVQANTFYK
jgi:sugar O-acyltransferase (sialic acid O-acetyltransferase NeuD family)